MGDVLDFPRRRPQPVQSGSTANKIDNQPPSAALTIQESKTMGVAPAPSPMERLEDSLDNYRASMLDVAHKRQVFEMQMALETNTAQIKLEAAGYRAMLAGVPESDIYALGEDMAEALSSAMDTVAGA